MTMATVVSIMQTSPLAQNAFASIAHRGCHVLKVASTKTKPLFCHLLRNEIFNIDVPQKWDKLLYFFVTFDFAF